MATPRIGAGFNYIFYGVLNSSGFFIGNTAAGPDAGDTNGQSMARLEGARTIPIEVGDDERLTVQGDNENLVQFSWESGELPSGILEMSVSNLDFEALVQGTKVATVGDINMGTLLPSGAVQPAMALLILRDSQKWSPGVRGVPAWEGFLVMKSEIRPLGATVTQREFNAYRYAFSISKTDRKTFGATYTEVADGTTQGAILKIESDNPPMVHSFRGNNSQDEITLLYEPVSDAKTQVFQNGVQTANWTRSGKVITMGSAPGTDVIVNVLYELSASEL